MNRWFCSTYQILVLWGRLVTCGRLAIGPVIFWNRSGRIANPPQVSNLPHIRRSCCNAPLDSVDELRSFLRGAHMIRRPALADADHAPGFVADHRRRAGLPAIYSQKIFHRLFAFHSAAPTIGFGANYRRSFFDLPPEIDRRQNTIVCPTIRCSTGAPELSRRLASSPTTLYMPENHPSADLPSPQSHI